ncbi:MAG: histidine phosphatase family protein [Bacteroidetes bacterium]|nr:MAG: histidine phosphatase family protein [Bacteroidota bacterium]
MLTFYFLRHGETDYNRRGIVQGRGIDSDLNDKGRAQAQAFFEHYNHLSFDEVWGSLLKRTHQTLAPWLATGYELQTHAGLDEFSWGIHEGKNPDEFQRHEFRDMLRRWTLGELDVRIEGGESPFDAWHRARPFFEDQLARPGDRRLLVCSHGRQLRVILSNLLGQDMRDMEHFKHHNTALTILHLHAIGEGELALLNSTAHLDTLEPA